MHGFNPTNSEVIRIEREKESGYQEIEIEVSNLSAGIYALKVLHGETKMVRKIVID